VNVGARELLRRRAAWLAQRAAETRRARTRQHHWRTRWRRMALFSSLSAGMMSIRELSAVR